MPPTVIKNLLAEHHDLQAVDAGEGRVDLLIYRGDGNYQTIYCALPGAIVGEHAAKIALQMLQSGIYEGIRSTRAPVQELLDGIVGENDLYVATRNEIHVEVRDKATNERMYFIKRESTAEDVTLAQYLWSQGVLHGLRVANDQANQRHAAIMGTK